LNKSFLANTTFFKTWLGVYLTLPIRTEPSLVQEFRRQHDFKTRLGVYLTLPI
jgi:hypothetical protein